MPVLIMQDTWLRWTKATRAAAEAPARLAVPRVHLLPQLSNDGTLRHEIMALEQDGRFHASLAGSNRSYFHEEHTVWVALLEAPTDRALLDLAPRKHIDMRTQIY